MKVRPSAGGKPRTPKKFALIRAAENSLRGRAIGQSDGHVYAGRHANALKNVATKFTPTCHCLIAQVDRSAARTAFLLCLIDPHQPVSMRKRERPQECAFDDGKDGGVRPDSERERSNGDETESRRFQQHAQCVAKIVHSRLRGAACRFCMHCARYGEKV
jgi:hypothetical protein